jgi:hypothetical protein
MSLWLVVVVAIGAEAVKKCELLYDHCNCCKIMSSHGAAAYNTIIRQCI